MKKVLYISEYGDIGGGESSLLNIILYFKEKKMLEPILLVPKDSSLEFLAKQKGIRVYAEKFPQFRYAWIKFLPLFNLQTMIRFYRIMKKECVDIIHINSSGSALVNSMFPSKILNIPIIWTCHGWWEKPFGIRAKIINKFVNKVFCVSNYVERFVRFPAHKVETTYLGIDLEYINSGDRKYIRDKWNINEDKTLIGVIGRYQKIKAQDLFIRVANRLVEYGYTNCLFFLIGDALFDKKNNKYKQKVYNLIRTSPYKQYFILLDNQINIPDIYAGLDIIVVPSHFESFSMVTIEAMAAGKKVVATNKGGPSEIITHKKNGYLFESENEEDLFNKLKMAIDDKCFNINEVKKRAHFFSIKERAKVIFENYRQVWGNANE